VERVKALIKKDSLNEICKIKEVSSSYISSKCKISIDKLERWKNPQDPLLPTFNQAKAISKCLHVPLAGLYMNSFDLPLEQIRKYKIRNFRIIHDNRGTDDSAINIAIGDLLQTRSFLLESKFNIGEEIRSFSIDFKASQNDPIEWALEIRKIFNISIQIQFSTPSTRKLYLYIRSALESTGIFVHCFTDVDVEMVRGISIYDASMPIIGINNNDRYPAQTFSLIHELVHVIKRQSTMCNDMFSGNSENTEEIFCNAVAGELLVPTDSLTLILKKRNLSNELSIDDISAIARIFSVSKEVITRRLYDCGRIKKHTYDAYINEINRVFRLEQEKQREASKIARAEGHQSGFPKRQEQVAVDKTSSELCKTLYHGYCEEYFSKQDVARYLGINRKHIEKFFKEVSSWH